MKKFLKKLAKKSLALLMVCLTLVSYVSLMSPVHKVYAAAETLNYSLSDLYNTHLTESAIANAGATFVTPVFVSESVPDGKYANILRSSTYTNNNSYAGNITASHTVKGMCDSKNVLVEYDWHVAGDTVVLVDGSGTKPQIPVIVQIDPDSNDKVVINGSWPSTTNFDLVDKRWYGIRSDAGDIQNLTGMYINDTGNGFAGSTTHNANLKYTVKGTAKMSAGSVYVEAGYSGSLVSTVKLDFVGWLSTPNATATSSNGPNITVVNYLPLKEALTEAASYVKTAVEDTAGEYTDASKEQLRVIANQLLAAKPDTTYFSGNSKCNYDNYKADAQAAITAFTNWKNGGGLVRQYNITWNIEGTKTTVKVVSGQTPSYTGATPTKAETNQYRYEFSGWTPAITAATKDAEYTATFNLIDRMYTVTFYGKDGNVLQTGEYTYGATVSAPNPPAIDGFSFKEWNPAVGATVTGNATYTAVYDQMFTVTFKNYDGNVITTVSVKKGDSATAPAAPSKPADADYEYEFDGWDKEFTNVTSNLEVTAKFKTKDHGNIQTQVVKNPDCTNPAMVLKYCADCSYQWNDGQPYYDATVAPALGHTFERDNPTWTVLPNGAKTDETHTVKCNACSVTTTKPHVFQDNPNHPGSVANCVTAGSTWQKCQCGMEIELPGAINPNKHDNVITVGYEAPKCGVPGYTGDQVCQDCGNTIEYGTEIPALEHAFRDEDYVSNGDATCTADGTETAVCYLCKDPNATNTRQDVGSKIPHSFTDYKYNDDAACEKNGTETAFCDYGCGTENTRDKEGTALAHNFTGTHKSNGDGTHSFLCQNGCNTYGGTVGCTYGAWVEVDGTYHKHTCTLCSYTPEATTHVWGDWKPVDSSAATAGQQTRSCTLCGCVDTKACVYNEKTVEADCENDAYTTYSCPDCGHGYTVIHPNTATGHNYSGKYNFDTKNDKHQQLCANGCGTYGVGTEKNAWADCEWTYANTEAGKHKATCVCGNSEVQNCSGGQATCTAQAECQYCHEAYGTTAPHSYTGTVISIETGKHAYLCVFCGDETHYGVGAEKDATEVCYGGTATCIKLAECEKCSKEYGDYALHSFDGTPVDLDGDVHAYRCSVCDDENLYGVGTEIDATENCSGGTATCSDKAVCDICHGTHGEIDPDAHKWSDWANIEGEEKHQRVCAHDSSHVEIQDCFSSSPAVAAPDCNTAGFTLNTCDDCGHTWQTEHVDPLGHDWSDWTNNGDGSHTRTCKRGCGYADNVQTEYCTKDDATAKVTDPTCTENGYTTYTCNICGYVWVDGDAEDEEDYVEPLGHLYKEKLIDEAHLKTAADCENAAEYWYDCARCEKNAKDEEDTAKYTELTFFYGKPAGHKFVNNPAEEYLVAEATCFAAAKYYTSCEVCEKSSEEINGAGKGVAFSYGSALEHDWEEVEENEYIATEADCANDATYYYVCSLCENTSEDYNNGATWTKENSKTGHTMTHVPAVAATCTSDGNLEYWYCSRCKTYYKDANGNEAYLGKSETVIDALKHDYVTVPALMPTCTEDGHPSYKYCKNCETDNGYQGEIPAEYKKTSHNFIGIFVCDEENDYHSRMCINCNEVSGMVVDGVQTAYKFENGTAYGGEKCTFTYKASTKDGVHTHAETCVCGNGDVTTFTDEETFDRTVAPTCTSKGYDEHSCKVCGETWTKNEVSALEHSWKDKAEPNGDGTHSVSCSVCGTKKDTAVCSGGTATCSKKAVCTVCGGEYGELGTHVYDGEWQYQNDAKCGVNGTEKNTCTVCGETQVREAAGTALRHEMSKYGYEVPEKLAQILADKGIVIKAPTCAEEGLSLSYCANCDYYLTKIVAKDANGHIWETDANGELVWKDAQGDCATGVTTKNYCTVCGKSQSKTEAGAHKWELKLFSKPTCVDNGYRIWKCETCSFSFDEHYGYTGIYKDQLPEGYANEDLAPFGAAGHSFSDTGKTQAATCTEAEKAIWKCVHCGEFDYRDIANATALGHKLSHHDAVKADCVFEGNVEYWSCSRCAATFADEAGTAEINSIVIPTVPHADNDGDTKCDKCGRVLYSGDDGKGSCGCICHKENFLMKIIYKILNFFWKLFKISKTCNCGYEHW